MTFRLVKRSVSQSPLIHWGQRQLLQARVYLTVFLIKSAFLLSVHGRGVAVLEFEFVDGYSVAVIPEPLGPASRTFLICLCLFSWPGTQRVKHTKD